MPIINIVSLQVRISFITAWPLSIPRKLLLFLLALPGERAVCILGFRETEIKSRPCFLTYDLVAGFLWTI